MNKKKSWYDKPWNTTIALFLFWPVGLYGLFKTSDKKGVLKRFFGIILIVVVCAYGASNPDSTNSSNHFFDAVKNSQWDGSVDVAERYLKRNLLKDPSSYESINWSQVSKNPDGSYQVSNTFRARNSFGGMGIQTITFIINSSGDRVINYYE